jgi:hypothetical protein
MNCKFHHKSTAREYRTQKLTEKSRLNHEGHEDYYKNIRPFVSFLSFVVRSEIRCILLCILSMEVSKDEKPTYY